MPSSANIYIKKKKKLIIHINFVPSWSYYVQKQYSSYELVFRFTIYVCLVVVCEKYNQHPLIPRSSELHYKKVRIRQRLKALLHGPQSAGIAQHNLYQRLGNALEQRRCYSFMPTFFCRRQYRFMFYQRFLSQRFQVLV